MEIKVMKLTDVVPYENNPRKNDQAVDAVMESIKQCGYVAPIIVDENHIILAGHTRYKALKKLGKKEAEVIIRSGLSDEQKRKYRILDNKTSEFADWDFEKLEAEMKDIDFGSFDFGFDFSKLDGMAKQISQPEPVFTPQGVNTEVPQDGVDPYLPEGYDDSEIEEYVQNQENYVVKRRIIITYLPEQEPEVKALLGIDGDDMKVVYDLEELQAKKG